MLAQLPEDMVGKKYRYITYKYIKSLDRSYPILTSTTTEHKFTLTEFAALTDYKILIKAASAKSPLQDYYRPKKEYIKEDGTIEKLDYSEIREGYINPTNVQQLAIAKLIIVDMFIYISHVIKNTNGRFIFPDSFGLKAQASLISPITLKRRIRNGLYKNVDFELLDYQLYELYLIKSNFKRKIDLGRNNNIYFKMQTKEFGHINHTKTFKDLYEYLSYIHFAINKEALRLYIHNVFQVFYYLVYTHNFDVYFKYNTFESSQPISNLTNASINIKTAVKRNLHFETTKFFSTYAFYGYTVQNDYNRKYKFISRHSNPEFNYKFFAKKINIVKDTVIKQLKSSVRKKIIQNIKLKKEQIIKLSEKKLTIPEYVQENYLFDIDVYSYMYNRKPTDFVERFTLPSESIHNVVFPKIKYRPYDKLYKAGTILNEVRKQNDLVHLVDLKYAYKSPVELHNEIVREKKQKQENIINQQKEYLELIKMFE